MSQRVAVLGGGSFGTCLALLAARAHDVTLWTRDAEAARVMQRERRNPRYLSDFALPERVRVTTDLADAVAGAQLVVCAIPSHGVREVMRGAGAHMAHDAYVVSTVKGIEVETSLLMHDVLAEVLPEPLRTRVVALSGPSFAREVAAGKPTAVTLACAEEAHAIAVQRALSSPTFRCYTHKDIVGVEVGGALKNVVAIAVGMSDGLGTGLSARSALMTRGLHEIARLGIALGADSLTFLGLSGMGDLILTCTGDLSRNRTVGLELARGRSLAEITQSMNEVAEGVRTTYAACRLAAKLGMEMPIATGLRAVLDGQITPAQAGLRLMSRRLKAESEGLEG
ncbi:MAG: NAD(P)-dependent glycerol-3-phosphate dehydrogenase [Deltaproteobacteria bacterium]|nr:NAD(P)-dependent glycerol-3-phosphate dehydrogenase [Deltaproteobacteria bacterium]